MNIRNRIGTIATVAFVIAWFAGPGLHAQTTTGKQEKLKTKQDKVPDAVPEKEDSTKSEDDAPEPIKVRVADDNIHFLASGTWTSVPPRSNMLEAELKIPHVEGDENDGRLTIMGAGGSIEANIERWKGQFEQADGSDTSGKTKTKKMEISGQTVHMVDITGTFMDAVGGPFSGRPKIKRENYRMMAAIIQTKSDGNYFVKLYGPKATIDKNAKHFKAMIESLDVAD